MLEINIKNRSSKNMKNRIIAILELFTKNVQGSNQKYLGNQKWITARLASIMGDRSVIREYN